MKERPITVLEREEFYPLLRTLSLQDHQLRRIATNNTNRCATTACFERENLLQTF